MEVDGVKLRAEETEHRITLAPALTVAGRVLDATTGQPIPRFRMVCGYPNQDRPTGAPNVQWDHLERFQFDFEKPDFQRTFEEPLTRRWRGGVELSNPGYVLQFEAKGYAPFVTRVLRPDEVEVRFDVRLKPVTATTGTDPQP